MLLLLAQDQIALPCRSCGSPAPHHRSQCPDCGSRTPYACAECEKPLSALSLGLTPTPKHPYGAYSESGEPLCHEHRLTACHECGELFRLAQMTRREVGKHMDTETREGMPPRLEPVHGYFCRECAVATEPAPLRETSTERYSGIAFRAALLVLGVLLTYLFVFAD